MIISGREHELGLENGMDVSIGIRNYVVCSEEMMRLTCSEVAGQAEADFSSRFPVVLPWASEAINACRIHVSSDKLSTRCQIRRCLLLLLLLDIQHKSWSDTRCQIRASNNKVTCMNVDIIITF